MEALDIFLDDFFELKKGVTLIQEHPAYIGDDDAPVLPFKKTQAAKFFKCLYLVATAGWDTKSLFEACLTLCVLATS